MVPSPPWRSSPWPWRRAQEVESLDWVLGVASNGREV